MTVSEAGPTQETRSKMKRHRISVSSESESDIMYERRNLTLPPEVMLRSHLT